MSDNSKPSLWSRLKSAGAAVSITHVVAAVLSAFVLGYFVILALPIALTAMADGRGITLSVLEVSPDNACDRASDIISNGAGNNEMAIYKDLVDRLLANRDFASLRATGQTGPAATASAEQVSQLDGYLKTALGDLHDLSMMRKDAFKSVSNNCVVRDRKKDPLTTGVIVMVVSTMAMLLACVLFSILKLSEAIKTPDPHRPTENVEAR